MPWTKSRCGAVLLFMSDLSVEESQRRLFLCIKERLHRGWKCTKDHLSASCERSVSILSRDEVPGTLLTARFAGPHMVEKWLNNTTYVIHTPDRKLQTGVCHINMLKAHQKAEEPGAKAVTTVTCLPVPRRSLV